MRRRRVRQAKAVAQPLHQELDKARTERPTLGAAEHRFVRLQPIGAQAQVALDGGARHCQHGHQALLVALAGHAQHVAMANGRRLRRQPQRFGNTQARAIEQRQHGDIARRDPVDIREGLFGDDRQRLLDGQRLGNRMGHFGQRGRQDGSIGHQALAFQIAVEGAQGGHLPGERARGRALTAARGHEGAEAANVQCPQIAETGRMAQMRSEESGELRQVAAVGIECQGRETTLVLHMVEPAIGGVSEIASQREF